MFTKMSLATELAKIGDRHPPDDNSSQFIKEIKRTCRADVNQHYRS